MLLTSVVEEKKAARRDAVLSVIRDASNMMTTVDTVFPTVEVKKHVISIFGFLAGVIGLYQNTIARYDIETRSY